MPDQAVWRGRRPATVPNSGLPSIYLRWMSEAGIPNASADGSTHRGTVRAVRRATRSRRGTLRSDRDGLFVGKAVAELPSLYSRKKWSAAHALRTSRDDVRRRSPNAAPGGTVMLSTEAVTQSPVHRASHTSSMRTRREASRATTTLESLRSTRCRRGFEVDTVLHSTCRTGRSATAPRFPRNFAKAAKASSMPRLLPALSGPMCAVTTSHPVTWLQ